MDAEITVVGLGSVGSMALWRAAERGLGRVLGIEQFGVGHTHGSFSGETRLFRMAYHEGARYVPILARSRELWQQLEAMTGRQLLIETGVLSVGRESSEPIRNVLRSVTDHALAHEVLRGAALAERFPQHEFDPDDIGVLDRQGGALRPESGVISAVEQARGHGAKVIENEKVLAVSVEIDHVQLYTDRRVVRTGRLILAGGSWSAEMQPRLHDLIAIKPLVLTWFAPRSIADFDAARFPGFIRDRGAVHFFGAPSLDGFSVKVSPDDRWAPVNRVDEVPHLLDPLELRALGVQAQAFFPGLNPEPVRHSVHHDGFASDKVPIVDLDASGRVVTMAGFSGHGFKMAPALGEIAVELALDGVSPLHHADFAIEAHSPVR